MLDFFFQSGLQLLDVDRIKIPILSDTHFGFSRAHDL